MSVSIKTAREIELMRESCHLLEKVHDELAKAIRPGISTWEIDHLGEDGISPVALLLGICAVGFSLISFMASPHVINYSN